MAIFKSRQVAKNKTERGVTSLSEQSDGGYFLLDTAKTTGDVIYMVRLGEDIRPTTIRVWVRNKVGALTLSTTSFTCGVAPVKATNFTRADGTVYTPVATSAALYGTVALATDGHAVLSDLVQPQAAKGWAPFFVTLTPSATITPTGAHELIMEVLYQGEEDVGTPAFTSFP